MNSIFKKKCKGTALFTVVCVMTMLSLMLVVMFMMLAVAQKKAQMSYYNSQSYTSAKTVLDVYTTYIVADPTSAPCITDVTTGIGATAQQKLRNQLLNLPVSSNWVLISADALDSANAPGMGKVVLEVKKETTSSYLIRATGTKASYDNPSGVSDERSEAVVTKRISCVQNVSPGLFENSLISMAGSNLGKANALMLGGVLSLTSSGTITGGTGIGSVGDFYSASDTTLGSSGYVLSQNLSQDASSSPPKIVYDVDTMEVIGDLTLDTSSGEISIFNNVDNTLGTPADWPKGQRPYIFVDGDLIVLNNAAVNIGCCQLDSTRFATQPREGYVDPKTIVNTYPVDIYVHGDVKIGTIGQNNADFTHCGNIYYTGSWTDTNSRYKNLNASAKQHVVNLPKTKTVYNPSDYKTVPDFMTSSVTVNGSTTTPQALFNAAMASPVTLPYNYNGTISSSAIMTGGLNGHLEIDISSLSNTANDDLWIRLDPDPSTGNVVFNFSDITINYGSVPVKDRVNIYFYSQNSNIDFNGGYIGLDKRNDTNSDFDQKTTGINLSTYKTSTHYFGSAAAQTNKETPSNIYFICDKGSVKFENNAIVKGYIYAPEAPIDLSNGAQQIPTFYNNTNYIKLDREVYLIGSIIGNNVSGSANSSIVAYVKPHNSILSKTSTTPPVWSDSGIFNNH